MSDSEFRPNMVGSNRNENVYNLSIALAPHLGIPADIIEQALIKAIGQNSADIFNTIPSSLHNGLQETKPVDELSQSTALISSGSNQLSLLDMDSKNYTTQESSTLSYKKNRKDSLSSLIEITQSGSTSINIKLPSLHVPPPTVQGEMTNGQSSHQSSSPFDENLNGHQYYDEKNIYNGSNNENLMQNQEYIPNHIPEVQNRQNESNFDVFKEYISPQQREQDKYKSYNQRQRDDLQADRFQDAYDSFMSDVESRQIDFTADFSEEYIQPQRRESQVNQISDPYNRTFSHVVSPIKKNPSETYLSEFPSLSEATKASDSGKNSGVDLGAWGQMDVNFASVWGNKSKRWSSETETNTFEPPATTSTWNPDKEDLTWKPIQEPKLPIDKKKPMPIDFDDSDGWGTPPTNTIPWNDSRQGYCVDLIEEQKETVFWSMQNGNWVNVSEEYSKTVEYTSDGVNRKNRQIMRIEHNVDNGRNVDNGATWEDLRENTRLEREREHQMERGFINENTADNIIVELSDHSNDNSDSSETGNYRSNSDTTAGPVPIVSEGPRERLGNPRWKTEKEWRHDSQPRQYKQEVECNDLINLDLNEIPESKELEEPLTVASDREVGEPNEEISGWDKWNDNSGSSLEEIVENKDDAWFTEDVPKRREDFTDQDLLINIDSNNDNEVAESTIINTHPPIFYGSVNNEMAKDLNDIFDSTNSVNTADNAKVANVDIVNDDLSLLSFEDDGNKISESSTGQENNNKNNPFDELEDFLKNNNYKPPNEIKDLNESQEKTPVTPYVISMNDKENSDISHYTTSQEKTPVTPYVISMNDKENSNISHYMTDNFSSFAPPSRSYRCENSNFESLSPSSMINNNDKKLEHNDEYRQDQNDQILEQYKGSVNEPQGAADPNKPNSNSARMATNDKDFIINLTVETPSNGRQILRLRYDDDPQIAATEFCKKWNMFNFLDALKGFVQKEQKRRLRKRRSKKIKM